MGGGGFCADNKLPAAAAIKTGVDMTATSESNFFKQLPQSLVVSTKASCSLQSAYLDTANPVISVASTKGTLTVLNGI